MRAALGSPCVVNAIVMPPLHSRQTLHTMIKCNMTCVTLLTWANHIFALVIVFHLNIQYIQLRSVTTYLHTHTLVHTYTHTYIHTHAHTHTHIHSLTHTYTHTHTQKMNALTPEDLHITPAIAEKSWDHSPYVTDSPSICMEVFECPEFSVGVFVLKPKKTMPLHDHPGMHGIL